MWWEAPEKAVFGVYGAFLLLGFSTRSLPVSITEHDPAVKSFEFPTVLDEGGGQPIQELRMGRVFAQETEVVGTSNQALAEVFLPNTVDDDSRGKRVVRGNDPIGQSQSSAGGAVLGGLDFRAWQSEQSKKSGEGFLSFFAGYESSGRLIGEVRGDEGLG